MKTNYIPTDEVKITNPFCFAYGFEGDVLSNNPDASKQLTVILRGGAGTWSFKYNEVSPMGLKISDTPKQTVDSNESIVKPEKRTYTRRDKTEVKVTKEKRKYNRKAK